MLVTVYVDDLMIACIDKNQVLAAKNLLVKKFSIKVKYIIISASKSIVLVKPAQFLLANPNKCCKAVATPFETNYQVICTEDNCEQIYQRDCQSLIEP